MTTPLSSSSKRLGWVDSARGICVVGVVVFHVCLWHYLPAFRDAGWDPAVSVWARINSYLASLRMPLLLAISGMLASRRIREGWGRPGALVRAVSSYYLYVVWLVVYFVFFVLVGNPALPDQVSSWPDLLLELVRPNTPLWYVFALAVYVVVLTSVRRVPWPVVLPVLALLSVAVLAVDPGWGMAEKIPENAVFFAAGVYGRELLHGLAGRCRPRDLAVTGVLAAATVLAARWSWGPVGDAALHVVRGLVFVGFGSLVVVVACRWRPFARSTEYIGRRTLQIYVLHVPLVMVVIQVFGPERLRGLTGWIGNPVVAASWPVLVTAATVVSCLVIHRILIRLRLTALFDMPPVVVQWVRRRYEGSPATTPNTVSATGPTAP